MNQATDSEQKTTGRFFAPPARLGLGVWSLVSVVCCLALTGCIRRSLTIRTQPEGALVYMNEQYKGESPVTYDFQWYGWYRVRIEKEGYARLNDHKQLKAPFLFWIPLDLFMELLPWAIRDDREWSYTLEPEQVISVPKRPSEPRWSNTVIEEEPGEAEEETVEETVIEAVEEEAVQGSPEEAEE